ncbi:hypothetical protein ANO11243_096990 [Dothideomycetidae sp. 11243]|nr:hypothetical protein ANO11243_096990 [fungal sp. No.11243]
MAPEKHLNLTKQDAAYRPATVKQKVKQWQGEGGGVVETATPPSKDLKTGQHAIIVSRTPPTPKPTEGLEMKNATSPKKRVVSDSHWRKDKTSSPAIPSPVTDFTSVPNLQSHRLVTQKSTPDFRPKVDTKRSSPAIPWEIRKSNLSPAKDTGHRTTPGRHRSRSRSRSRSRERRRHDVVSAALNHLTGNIAASREETPRRKSDRDSFEPRSKNKPQIPSPRSNVETEDPFSIASPGPDDSVSRRGPLPAPPEHRSGPKPHVGPTSRKVSGPAPLFDRNGLVTKDRAKPVPSASKLPGNRIEAWLGGQEDPFCAQDTSSKDGKSISSPVPEPLRPHKRSSKRKSSGERQPLKTNAQNRQFSFEQGDESSVLDGKYSSPRDKENADRAHRVPSSQHKPRMRSDNFMDASDSPSTQGIGLGINMRREFPSTGKALSTIASVVTQETRGLGRETKSVPVMYAESAISLTTIGGGGTGPGRKKSTGLKRSLTKHDDLMTVLSATGGIPSLVSARSFRAQKLKLDKMTIEDTMKNLAKDEEEYQAELQTLVDGVIPALLSSVLSKASSAKGGNLFAKDGDGTKVTQPIVDMGVALERLRSQHKRIASTNPSALLIWAQNAARVYDDYINAWRMGFNDVVVNVSKNDRSSWHQGLARNSAGDLLNAKGDRVDVAFLLKRPLVRVKNLTKTLREIHYCKPSPDAEATAERYHALVLAARKKSSDELARLEDEAANAIDATRARDPRSLAPLAGVRIDRTRSVRARDYFEMTLRHSTGQRIDCAVEIFIRDNEADPSHGGDILICEVSDNGRWLLFPPIIQDMVSARRGKSDLDLIFMIRGVSSDGSDWSELLTLHSSTEDAVEEWASMLAEGPTPPSPTQTTFTMTPDLEQITPLEDLIPKPLTPRPRSVISSPQPLSPGRTERPTVTFKSRTPSPTEVEVPIGEQAQLLDQATPGLFKRVSGTHPSVSIDQRKLSKVPPNTTATTQRSSRVEQPGNPYAYTDKAVARDLTLRPGLSRGPVTLGNTSSRSAAHSPRSDGTASTRRDRSPFRAPQSHRPSLTRSGVTTDSTSTASDQYSDEEALTDEEDGVETRQPGTRPAIHLRTASTPSQDMPAIPRLRQHGSRPRTPNSEHLPNETNLSSDVSRDSPSSAPGKLQKIVGGLKLGSRPETKQTEVRARPKSSFFSAPNFLKRNNRPPSPLKRQYTVSSRHSDSETDFSDSEISDEDADSLSSYSTEDDEHKEKYDAFDANKPPIISPPLFARKTPPQSLASFSGPSLGPSNSASQGPYRSVPQQASDTCTKTVANVFSWSDRGIWDPLHPVEVSVVVSPGLIEAFTMSESQSVPSKTKEGLEVSPSRFGVRPLIALELTPLVPLRRGTALDISIRSPPTSNSQIVSSSNVMFRSRSPEECEYLYGLINQARINNATFIALQNARPNDGVGTWAAQMDRRNAMRSASNSSSWFGLGSRRGSTYRSNSVRKRHISVAASDSSIGTMNTAFSALRRLSGSGMRAFNRSRFESSTTSDSPSSGYATPTNGGLGMVGANGALPDLALGIKEVKIRLYRREAGGKWRDMGSARLTIMASSSSINGASSPERPGSAVTGAGVGRTTATGKRILICGTTKGETLLDVILGESSFERVARTGIAVSVWRDNEGSNGDTGRATDTGGVGASKMDVYMVQMKTERDAAYTFGLVGKQRY